MESTLDGTFNCLQFFDCALDTAKQNEELQGMPPQ